MKDLITIKMVDGAEEETLKSYFTKYYDIALNHLLNGSDFLLTGSSKETPENGCLLFHINQDMRPKQVSTDQNEIFLTPSLWVGDTLE